jgi:hypothetical protein
MRENVYPFLTIKSSFACSPRPGVYVDGARERKKGKERNTKKGEGG